MLSDYKGWFPNIQKDHFIITSPETTYYNCIAWACDDNEKWYWPDAEEILYWPENVPREETVDAFILLFASLGYSICENPSLEEDHLKIALYCSALGKPTHAARQLPDGTWTSKLGRGHDVLHTLDCLSSVVYGEVAVFMKRLRS